MVFLYKRVCIFKNFSVCPNIGKAISKAVDKKTVQCLMPSSK